MLRRQELDNQGQVDSFVGKQRWPLATSLRERFAVRNKQRTLNENRFM